MPNWNHIVREHLAVLRLPPEREIEIVEELALHMEAAYEDALAAGLSEAEAEARAVQRYDWRLLECELSRAETPLAARALLPSPELTEPKGVMRMGSFIQDLRFGIRALGKKPSFTALVTLTLALGIGANTAIFSLFNGLVLKPLPYKEPGRLANLRVSAARGMRYQPGVEANFGAASPGGFHDWRARSRSFANMTAYRTNSTIFADGEQTQYVVTVRAAEQFFETHGVKAQLGRAFTSQDYSATASAPIILDHNLWQNRYGADPNVIGRTIKLDGEPRTIVGVMAPAFWPTPSTLPPRVWVPYVFNAEEQSNRQSGRWNVTARLRDGVSFEQAQAEMDVLAAQLSADFPADYKNRGVVVIPADAEFLSSLGNVRQVFRLLLGAVGLVLLIACVNVANLLLVRAMERERDFAVRSALGASGWRLARQLLTESLLLALIGGAVGLLLGALGMRLVTALLTGAYIPRLDDLRFDWQAFAFTGGVSLFTGLLFGLVPALRAARPDLQQAINEGGRGNASSGRRRRLGKLLVTGEVAVALLLAVGAGLIVRSFVRLQRVDPGFAASRLLKMHVDVPDYKYGRFSEDSLPGSPEVESRVKLFPKIEERVSALPGVESAAVAALLPVMGLPQPIAISIAGRAGDAPDSLIDDQKDCDELRRKTGLPCHGTVCVNRVTTGYLRTIGLRLARGRWFDSRDKADNPLVAVISEATARKYWPQSDPIGQRLTLNYSNRFPQIEIIGVVSDVRTDGLYKPPYPEIYQPMSQQPSDNGQLIIRAKAAPETLAAVIREEMTRLDPDMPVRSVRTMEGVISDSLWWTRLAAWLFGLFAALAVTLAAAGLYGVMSYAVSQRTNEIGIRMALGATAADVLGMALGEGSRLVLAGLALGLTAAFLLSRLLAGLLFEVTATDALTFAGATFLLGLTALLACWIPARRATKVDPLTALRHE
jgi:putative ABC transport system permease protein